ncbi:class C sortase [Bifidobacterium castoris]|uniref:Sortase n=1 Tax=Bifidobacterium castoris TaxID=2306972 RepID=A0A430F6Y6_9BIFI|nr:class C sortase [Bifidobacterium castoris]RSX48699.1 sortase [Bifidobacterium castoris]
MRRSRGGNGALGGAVSETDDWLWVLGRDEATVEHQAYRRKALRQSRIIMCCALMFFILAALAIGVPWYMQWRSDLAAAAQIEAAERDVAEWPYPQAELALKAAEQYNAVLAKSGQPTLGETYDPFSGAADGQTVRSDDDAEYTSLLNAGDSVIGSVIIPKISVNLPIRHGTSKLTLDRGVGHLYGTSLPTGAEGAAGGSAHTVLTGHRGLVEALMFTRLDEMKVGDFMYEKVFGRTLAYRVDRISVIDPSDTSQLRIRSGEDRLTLMTCTPFGVNTQRLLVSGTRVSIPEPAPEPQNSAKDMTRALQWAVVLAAALALAASAAHACIPSVRRTRERRRCRPRHAGQWD